MTAKSPPEEDPGVIERLDAGEPPASPEEAQARAPYERLFDRIRGLDDPGPPAGWEDRAMARWSAARRKRRLGIVIGVTAAAGLAATLLLRPCAPPSGARLEVAALRAPGSTRRGDPAVGDLLRARAREDRAHVQLRLYLGTKLIAQCPGGEPCQRDGSVFVLDWKLVEAGRYQVVVLSSNSEIPALGDTTIDHDLLEARTAGASIETETVNVSP